MPGCDKQEEQAFVTPCFYALGPRRKPQFMAFFVMELIDQ